MNGWTTTQTEFQVSYGIYFYQVRALIGKKWDPQNQTWDVCEEHDEAGDIKPRNSDEPVETASPHPSEGINLVLPKEALMASP